MLTNNVRKTVLHKTDAPLSHAAHMPGEADVHEMITLKQSRQNCPKGFKQGPVGNVLLKRLRNTQVQLQGLEFYHPEGMSGKELLFKLLKNVMAEYLWLLLRESKTQCYHFYL